MELVAILYDQTGCVALLNVTQRSFQVIHDVYIKNYIMQIYFVIRINIVIVN